MLFYTTPSYDDYTTSSPSTLHQLSRFVPQPARTPTARERYLSAVAEAQAAREGYLRELEAQRVQESLLQQEVLRQAELRRRDVLLQAEFRRQEALRQAELRRQGALGLAALHRQEELRQAALHAQEALHQAALHHRQPQFIARRRGARASMSGCYPEQPFAPLPRVQPPSPPVQSRQQFQTVEQLFAALMGVDEGSTATESPQEQQLRQQVHEEEMRQQALQDAKARLFRHLDEIKAEVSQARAAYDSGSQGAEPAPAQPSQAQDKSSQGPTRVEIHRIPLFRRPEVPRVHDRAARTIQRQWRSHSADAAARKDALATIELLRSRFQFLHNTFVFPEHLDFKGGDAEKPALSYSPLNAAVHAYTNELTKLLMQADAIPSGGSKRVRDARRAFVQVVEEQLGAVEARVTKIWGKRVESQETPVVNTAPVKETLEAPAVTFQAEEPSVVVPSEAPAVGVQSEVPAESVQSEAPATVGLEAEPEALSYPVLVRKTSYEPAQSDVPPVTSQVSITSEEQPQSHEGDSIPLEEHQENDLPNPTADDDTHSTVVPATLTTEGDISIQESVVADLDARTSVDEQDNNVHDTSSDPVPSPSPTTSHPDVSSEAPESVPSAPISDSYPPTGPAVDPPTLGSAQIHRATSEPFDVVYPDSRSTTPSKDSAQSLTDDERPKQHEHEDDEFEIL